MVGPSPDGLSYLLDDSPNSFLLNSGFLNPYPEGLFALGGNDLIVGSADPELMQGGRDNDRLLGNAGADTLWGGTGNDFLNGGQGADLILGESGNNTLQGGRGNDDLVGSTGDDILSGDSGKDTLTGGTGSDFFVLRPETATFDLSQADSIVDFDRSIDAIALSGNLGETDLTLQSIALPDGTPATLIQVQQSGAILGIVFNVSPDDLQGTFISAIGLLGNELSQARDLGTLNGTQTFQNFVDDARPEEIYRFTVATDSYFQLSLSNLSGDVDLAVVKDINSNNTIDVTDIIASSEQPNLSPESIEISSLTAGTYYIWVYQYQGTADFTLTVSATPTLAANNGSINNQGFDTRFGFGLVDAAAGVARATLSPPFPEVPDLNGNDWPRDLIKAPEVWAQGITGRGVVIALLDTGVDYNHPDLAGNIWTNGGETGVDGSGRDRASNGVDDDRNGFVDDIRGWDFVASDNDPMDENRHGTHVAGVLAAKNDGTGMTGVAPDAIVMPLRILNQNAVGRIRNEVAAIRYAADRGAKIINLSLGGEDFSAEELEAIRYAESKGAIVLSAAGNDARPQPDYPAQFADEVGIAVGSIDRNRQLSYYSNRAGARPIEYLLAPGGEGGFSEQNDIFSTVPLSQPGIPYDYLAGTSMATPHVAGVIALMLQANPNLTPAQIKRILAETANQSGISV